MTEIDVSEISNSSDTEFVFPEGFSFFEPYLRYHVKETLETGGDAYISRDPEGSVSGLFIYDNRERTGSIFTRSPEVFDFFYGLKPFDFLFAELPSDHQREIYDIHTIDLCAVPVLDHRFRHEISVADKGYGPEIKRFMFSTHPRINKQWIDVALRNGQRCFIAKLDNEIAGIGWTSIINHIGRLHSLYVRPQFRRMGIGEDITYARLLWLKLNRASSAFSEIARSNLASSRVAMKARMKVSGQIFLYFRNEVLAARSLQLK